MNRFHVVLMAGLVCQAASAQTRDEVLPEARLSQLVRSTDQMHADYDLQRRAAAADPRRVLEYNRSFLAEFWAKAGLPAAEARSVAATFESTEEQSSIDARARREGREATVAAALEAYGENRPLLANQLVVAAARAPAQ